MYRDRLEIFIHQTKVSRPEIGDRVTDLDLRSDNRLRGGNHRTGDEIGERLGIYREPESLGVVVVGYSSTVSVELVSRLEYARPHGSEQEC